MHLSALLIGTVAALAPFTLAGPLSSLDAADSAVDKRSATTLGDLVAFVAGIPGGKSNLEVHSADGTVIPNKALTGDMLKQPVQQLEKVCLIVGVVIGG